MQLLSHLATAQDNSIIASTQKEVGRLIVYSTSEFESLVDETINIFVERSAGNNSSITKMPLLLQPFVMASTFDEPAIASFHADYREPYKTVAVIPLTQFGNIELSGNDNLTVELDNLQDGIKYVIDAVQLEDTNPDQQDIYEFEEKRVATEQTDYTVSLDAYDTCVIQDTPEIRELNITYANGHVQKLTLRELRAMTISTDPVQLIKQNGEVRSAFRNYLAFDSSDMVSINLIKYGEAQVTILFRHNIMVKKLIKTIQATKPISSTAPFVSKK